VTDEDAGETVEFRRENAQIYDLQYIKLRNTATSISHAHIRIQFVKYYILLN